MRQYNISSKETGVKILILLTIVLLLNASAMTIDEEILNVQQSGVDNRYKLMNALKSRISSMNVNDRKQAIMKLRKSSNVKSGAGISGSKVHPPKRRLDKSEQKVRLPHRKIKEFNPLGTGMKFNQNGKQKHRR